MIFTELAIAGVYLVEPAPHPDERGFFARTFSREEFELHGLSSIVAQCSVSFNPSRGTLRGLHYQALPHAESKLVRCTRGAIYDVVADPRPDSSTYCRWLAVELTADNHRALYVPEGLAHGFQTLEHRSEVSYQMSSNHVPSAGRGVRWDDPAVGIIWPEEPRLISERDREYASLR